LPAPVKKGAEIARLKVMRGTRTALDAPLFAGADVPAGGLLRRATDGALELTVGWVRTAVKSVFKR
jgi:D-alanyl-D-alanine carboxypeptidase (penicillin-binding protein 5/6)